MKPVSHAERIAKRHARQVAASPPPVARRATTPSWPAPGGTGEVPEGRRGHVERADGVPRVPPQSASRTAPPQGERAGEDAGTEPANPFAQFMGCAP